MNKVCNLSLSLLQQALEYQRQCNWFGTRCLFISSLESIRNPPFTFNWHHLKSRSQTCPRIHNQWIKQHSMILMQVDPRSGSIWLLLSKFQVREKMREAAYSRGMNLNEWKVQQSHSLNGKLPHVLPLLCRQSGLNLMSPWFETHKFTRVLDVKIGLSLWIYESTSKTHGHK